ncbi:kelch-like protein 41b [Arctopsyche grandis]|uniref:kelch-like protein 41b n=1 Tax=Arctopsyche grandis TaxID=121162 RepID=UPI00406DA116
MYVDFHGASVIDNKIYVTGGRSYENGTHVSRDKLQVYSIESNSWNYRAQMTQARSHHSSVAFKGKIFIAGGYMEQTSTYLDSVDHYDPITNVWTAFTKLPKPQCYTSLCCFQNKIICLGGSDGLYMLSDVWEYDETNKNWKSLKRLSRSRSHAIAHVIPYNSII